jgi:hypothetical protein
MTKMRFKGRNERRDRRRDGTKYVTHTFPDEVVKVDVNDEPQAASEPRLTRPTMLGLVERGDMPDKKLMAAYIILEERDTKNVYFYPSKDESFYVFYLQAGLLSMKPEMSNQRGGYLAFGNYPEPKYHTTFRTPSRADDLSSSFESHSRNIIARRVKEMVAQKAASADIARYKNEAEHFMTQTAELFRKHGHY